MMKPLFLGTLLHMLGRSSFLYFHAVEAFPLCSLSLVHNSDNVMQSLHCGQCYSICTTSSGRRSYHTRISVRNSLFGRGGDEEQRPSNENASSSVSSSSLRAVDVSSSNTTAGSVVINGRSPPVNISNHVSSSSSTRNNMGTSLRDSIMVTREKDNAVIGIGGNGGVVYNVNILKRNLLQE